MTKLFACTLALASRAAAVASATTTSSAVLFVKHPETGKARLLAELEQRSDPDSPMFLSWLSKDEVEALLMPAPAHLAEAFALAARHGASRAALAGADKIVATFDGDVPRAFLDEARAAACFRAVTGFSFLPQPARALLRAPAQSQAGGLLGGLPRPLHQVHLLPV